MCGIAGIHVKEAHVGSLPVADMADFLLLGIENRGRHATGFVSVDNEGKIVHNKMAKKATDFIADPEREAIPDNAKTILLHTRFATQGKPEDNVNNHPVLYETCFSVHNGIIRNDGEIFKELEIPRTAEVDSIAISAALSYHGFGSEEDIKTALESLEGFYAIAAIDPEQKPGRLVLAKGSSSPLIVLNHPKCLMWASELKALKDAWGIMLGTPPSKRADPQRGKMQGLYDFRYGDYWMIDGDEIKIGEFRPKWKTAPYRPAGGTDYRNAGFRNGSETDDGWDDYLGMGGGATNWEEDFAPSRSHSSGSSRSTLSTSRDWTCDPDYANCNHPCRQGCEGATCGCWPGNPNHPFKGSVSAVPIKPASDNLPILRQDRDDGTTYLLERSDAGKIVESVINTDTGELVEDSEAADELVECDGCMDFVDADELAPLVLGTIQYELCEGCLSMENGTWGEPPFRAESDSGTLPDDASYSATARRENHIHARAIRELSSELDTTPAFIDWLLFRLDPDDVEHNEILGQLRQAVEHEYELAKTFAGELYDGNFNLH